MEQLLRARVLLVLCHQTRVRTLFSFALSVPVGTFVHLGAFCQYHVPMVRGMQRLEKAPMPFACHAVQESSVCQAAALRAHVMQEVTVLLLLASRLLAQKVLSMHSRENLLLLIAFLALLDSIALKDHSSRTLALQEPFLRLHRWMTSRSASRA